VNLLVARIGDGLAATPHLKVWLDAPAAWPGACLDAGGLLAGARLHGSRVTSMPGALQIA